MFHLLSGGAGRVLEQRGHTHDKSRSAIAAHKAILIDERLLNVRELPVLGQSFNRRDFVSLCLKRELRAGVDRRVIQ